MSQVTVCLFRSHEGAWVADIDRQVREGPDPQETWRTIGDVGTAPRYYEVCPGTDRHPWGQVRIWDFDRFWFGEPVSIWLSKGYPKVWLDGRNFSVHRLILLAFKGPCPPGLEACHGNDTKTDNRLANLSWDTKSKNMEDRVRNGRHYWAKRTHCDKHPGVLLVPRTGKRKSRYCPECQLEASRRFESKNRERRIGAKRRRRARPDVRQRELEYSREYESRPDVVERRAEYNREYNARPEVKEQRAEYDRQRYRQRRRAGTIEG